MNANDLSALLWRERALLERLLLKLETERFFLREGSLHWLGHSTEVLDEVELDTPAVVPWWTKHRHTTVERLLVHMIAESHRHAGHLDIVREQLDGFIGLRPAAPNIPGFTPDQWEEQRLRIKELADGA